MTALSPSPTPDAASFVRKHARHNFAMIALDYGAYSLGMSFVSVTTIAPALAERLGAPNIIIGLIPALMTVEYALPTLFFANYTERLARKLPFLLRYTIWERLPILFVAVAAYFLAVDSPGVVLAILFASLGLVFLTGGALTPAWMEMIAKVVATRYRARVFAVGSTLGALLGLGGALLSERFLSDYPFPVSYALCFGTGFVFLMGSFGFITLVREPPVSATKPHLSFRDYARQLPAVLGRDSHFAWFLASRCLGMLGGMAGGFYTVYALRDLGAPEWQVARFTFVTLAATVISTVAFGFVGDHLGHKVVLVSGGLAAIGANVLAAGASTVDLMYVVFAASAVSAAGGTVSGLNMPLEFAPEPERPTYVGLAGTLTAPFAAVGPLIGGLLADTVGYNPVFVLSAVLGIGGTLLLLLRVADPRRRLAPRPALDPDELA